KVALEPVGYVAQETLDLIRLVMLVCHPVSVEDRGTATAGGSRGMGHRVRPRLRWRDDIPQAGRDIAKYDFLHPVPAALQQAKPALAHRQQQEVLVTGEDPQQRAHDELCT